MQFAGLDRDDLPVRVDKDREREYRLHPELADGRQTVLFGDQERIGDGGGVRNARTAWPKSTATPTTSRRSER